MEIILLGITILIGIIGLSKFFTLCYDMRKIRSDMETFTKYYYDMQKYKITNDKI